MLRRRQQEKILFLVENSYNFILQIKNRFDDFKSYVTEWEEIGYKYIQIRKFIPELTEPDGSNIWGNILT